MAQYSGWRQSEMCRNIRTLFNFEPPVTEEEILAASLQFVRKISGFNKPSKTNEAPFYAAVDDIARISGRLLGSLVVIVTHIWQGMTIMSLPLYLISQISGRYYHKYLAKPNSPDSTRLTGKGRFLCEGESFCRTKGTIT